MVLRIPKKKILRKLTNTSVTKSDTKPGFRAPAFDSRLLIKINNISAYYYLIYIKTCSLFIFFSLRVNHCRSILSNYVKIKFSL